VPGTFSIRAIGSSVHVTVKTDAAPATWLRILLHTQVSTAFDIEYEISGVDDQFAVGVRKVDMSNKEITVKLLEAVT